MFRLLFILLLPIVSSNNACSGSIQNYTYDLHNLAKATGYRNMMINDTNSDIYYYKPCYHLNNEYCNVLVDQLPAVCQKDHRKIPQMHDCGSTINPTWTARKTGPNTGFIILFQGGELGRMTNIEFICNKTIGVGKLSLAKPHEYPKYFYHLVWESSLVCPV